MGRTVITIDGRYNKSDIIFDVDVEFSLMGDCVRVKYEGNEIRVAKDELLYVLSQLKAVVALEEEEDILDTRKAAIWSHSCT